MKQIQIQQEFAKDVRTVGDLVYGAALGRVAGCLSIWHSVCFCFHSVVFHVPLSSRDACKNEAFGSVCVDINY